MINNPGGNAKLVARFFWGGFKINNNSGGKAFFLSWLYFLLFANELRRKEKLAKSLFKMIFFDVKNNVMINKFLPSDPPLPAGEILLTMI